MSMMTGKIKNMRVVHFLLVVILMTLSGLSRAAPVIDSTFDVTTSYDKSGVPQNVKVFSLTDPRYPHDAKNDGWRGGLVCRSDTDTMTGACATGLRWSGDHEHTAIELNFEEQRSHSVIRVALDGAQETLCSGFSLNDAIAGSGSCYGDPVKSAWVYIYATELARFPAGIWKAKLVLDALSWDPEVKEATITANITLKVTDNGSADIFFPTFNTATPVVNLNLNTRPLSPGSLPADRKNVSGGAHVDLCLYDGYNLNSPWLDVSVSDPQTVTGRSPDEFSVKDGSGNVDDAHRLDYKVMLNYGGQSHPMINGQSVKLEHTDKGPARPVTLVNVPGTVLCAPAALDLSVVPFANLSKAAGHYSGKLSVTLSANTQTP